MEFPTMSQVRDRFYAAVAEALAALPNGAQGATPAEVETIMIDAARASEDQIERAVEIMTDRLDRAFTTTAMSQQAYNARCSAIAAWAEEALRKLPR